MSDSKPYSAEQIRETGVHISFDDDGRPSVHYMALTENAQKAVERWFRQALKPGALDGTLANQDWCCYRDRMCLCHSHPEMGSEMQELSSPGRKKGSA